MTFKNSLKFPIFVNLFLTVHHSLQMHPRRGWGGGGADLTVLYFQTPKSLKSDLAPPPPPKKGKMAGTLEEQQINGLTRQDCLTFFLKHQCVLRNLQTFFRICNKKYLIQHILCLILGWGEIKFFVNFEISANFSYVQKLDFPEKFDSRLKVPDGTLLQLL